MSRNHHLHHRRTEKLHNIIIVFVPNIQCKQVYATLLTLATLIAFYDSLV